MDPASFTCGMIIICKCHPACKIGERLNDPLLAQAWRTKKHVLLIPGSSHAIISPNQVVHSSKPDAVYNSESRRSYDIHITYDNYYRTPRLWLFGYDEVGVGFLDSCLVGDQVKHAR